MEIDADPSPQDLLLWQQYTNTHGLRKSCGEKGTARPLSQERRVPQPLSLEENSLTLALNGFYCFSRPLTSKMVLLYYVKFCFGWLSFTDKGEDVTSKKDICNVKGEMVQTAIFHTWKV